MRDPWKVMHAEWSHCFAWCCQSRPVSLLHRCLEAAVWRQWNAARVAKSDPCMRLRAQSPFANLTLGALFFAVVHEKRRPDLGAFEAAVARGGEHAGLMRQYRALMQRCWSQDPAERPNFLKASALPCWGLPRLSACPGGLLGSWACVPSAS